MFSGDTGGDWHAETRHPIEDRTGHLRFNLLSRQTPARRLRPIRVRGVPVGDGLEVAIAPGWHLVGLCAGFAGAAWWDDHVRFRRRHSNGAIYRLAV